MKRFKNMTPRRLREVYMTLCLLLCSALLFLPGSAAAEGSRDLYPNGQTTPPDYRANLEWNGGNNSYGPNLRRRTLLKVFVEIDEYILMGSSAIDVSSAYPPNTPNINDLGDILIYDDLVDDTIGKEILPATPVFSCVEQRAETNNVSQGRIATRDQEVNGPATISDESTATPAPGQTGKYVPCFFRAQKTGIYQIVFYGPDGPAESASTSPTGKISDPNNANASQSTTVAMWDVTVRKSLLDTVDQGGRLFTYYLSMFTGTNGRPIHSMIYIVTTDGFRYEIGLNGMDPNGFVLYGNQLGFLNTDGVSPLYRDVMADPTGTFDQQNQLFKLQGGVSLSPPEYPIFFNLPDDRTLQAIGLPLEPIVPIVTNFVFTSPYNTQTTLVDEGGTFTFESTVPGVYEITVSRDGQDFDPANPQNRVLRGVAITGGTVSIPWNGRDNSDVPFPVGYGYQAKISVHGGELHFPFLDVENSIEGSPMLRVYNPPNENCAPLVGGCSGGFYDDRGYITIDPTTGVTTTVGTAVNGPLCPAPTNTIAGNPPNPLFSDPIKGFDTSVLKNQRAFGFSKGGNPPNICNPNSNNPGGFGDKKGLDLWTYYPSDVISTPLNIVADVTAVTLTSFDAAQQGRSVLVSWETSAEINTWGFYLMRSTDGTRTSAQRITPALIPAQGRGQGGASYSWIDVNVQPGLTYTYWLQEVETNGAINEYGPASVSVGRPASAWRLFVPLINE